MVIRVYLTKNIKLPVDWGMEDFKSNLRICHIMWQVESIISLWVHRRLLLGSLHRQKHTTGREQAVTLIWLGAEQTLLEWTLRVIMRRITRVISLTKRGKTTSSKARTTNTRRVPSQQIETSDRQWRSRKNILIILEPARATLSMSSCLHL